MSRPVAIAQAILDTVLGRLALLFLTGAGGDLTVARNAASQMLAAYNVETEHELSLAGEVISFGFHALEALSQAAAPDLSLNQKLRLRGSAVSLSREGHKAHRKLDQLQRQRRGDGPKQPAEALCETTAAAPEPEPAARLIEFAREAIQAAGKKNGAKNWTQSFQQRQAAKRITENLKKKQAEHECGSVRPNAAKADAVAAEATA